jgi:pimeloyl-ACP methyl ester carboxylesterase
VASLDVVDDLEVLRTALGVDAASVVAWGRGATIAAAWKMLHPVSVNAMVLDTPWDPSVSTRKQGIRQVESSVSVARAAVKWCASHLSCPLNANTTADLRTILKHVRDGRLDPRVTREMLARAATASLAQGDPRTLFVGITQADENDPRTLVELAGDPPNLDDAQSACADVSVGSASAIVSAYTKMTRSKRLLFHVGIDGPLYSMCGDLPPAVRVLGTVKPVASAIGAKVLTVVARNDPTWPALTVSNMASRMKWTHKTVAVSRHLVIGFDRATTVAAVAFLVS